MQSQVVGVRFMKAGKVYNFLNKVASALNAGDYVVVETSRGTEMGWVVNLRDLAREDDVNALKPIVRQASSHDLVLREHFRLQEKDVLKQARMLAVEQSIRFKLAKAEFSFDGTRLTLYYGSEKEVELARLQRDLGRKFNSRVEFRQVGPRDVAKMMGGAGACGLAVRCCSAFLTDFQPISIKMAKAQDLPLVPTEIAGMCGRLRCCLQYEYEFYKDARKGMPKVGKWVVGEGISGKVVDRNIPKGTVMVQSEDGKRTEMEVSNIWVNESGQPPAQGGSCGTGGGGGCGGACSTHKR